jgi:hypothetical protein
MNWRDTIIAALDPAKVIDVIDERDLGSDALDYRAAAVLIAITDRPDRFGLNGCAAMADKLLFRVAK